MAIGDQYFENVALLLHCDGINNGTSFPDSSNHNHAQLQVGDAKTSTVQAKFGTASIFLDGAGDGVTAPASTLFDFSGDFTIEMWVRPTSIKLAYFYGRVDSPGYAPILLHISASGNVMLASTTASGSWTFNIAGAITLAVDTWYHVAAVRAGNTWQTYIDGVLDVNTTSPHAPFVNTELPLIGRNKSADAFFAGYIDDVRLTDGVARYTSNFTPPAAAFADYFGQLAGNITESLAITDWRLRVHKVSSGILSKEGLFTGASYSFDITDADAHTIIISPEINGKWRPSTAIALNFLVVSADPESTPHLWKCTTAGTTGAAEPTWNLSGTTNDGTVVWTYVDALVDPVALGPKIPS